MGLPLGESPPGQGRVGPLGTFAAFVLSTQPPGYLPRPNAPRPPPFVRKVSSHEKVVPGKV